MEGGMPIAPGDDGGYPWPHWGASNNNILALTWVAVNNRDASRYLRHRVECQPYIV